jgi:hypothetical protein
LLDEQSGWWGMETGVRLNRATGPIEKMGEVALLFFFPVFHFPRFLIAFTHRLLGIRAQSELRFRYDWRNNSVLFVHNLSPIPKEVKFGAGAGIDGELVNLLSDDHSLRDASGKHSMLLEPYG